MWQFARRRLTTAIPLLVIVSFIVFFLLHLSPGDPAARAAGGSDALPADIIAARERLGLNEPLHIQYLEWLRGLVVLDLGTSLFSSRPVTEAIASALPVTLSLTFGAVVVALLIAIPTGILAARRQGGALDRLIMIGASLGIALPNFFVGLMLVLVFALTVRWFPATGYVDLLTDPWRWLQHMTLPWIALGIAVAAELARHLRGALRDVLSQDYVRTAYAKGLPGRLAIGKHGLKNAAIPVVTVLGLQIRALLGGVVVIEQVFSLPGLGSLAVHAVFNHDYPIVQGVAMVSVAIVLIVNWVVDLSYGYFNPRVRSA